MFPLVKFGSKNMVGTGAMKMPNLLPVATLGDTPQDRSIPISVSLPMKAKASRG
jgi:hypothetical protein